MATKYFLAIALGLSCDFAAALTIPVRVTASNINVSLIPSRTSSCIAPCAVFFDATGTTSATGVTANPFHDMRFSWSFGDSGAGTWSYGSTGNTSKNAAYGATAAHVYETAGTYTVTLTVYDGTNTATQTTSITVGDADTEFTGTKTICVSSSGTPTPGSGGCPAGASGFNQTNYKTAMDAYATNNVRVLFKCGDTFTTSVTTTLTNKTGPGIIGAYPVGCANRPIIQMTGNTTTQTISGSSDWRFMDLDIDLQSGGSTMGINATGAFNNFLALRLDVHDGHKGIQFSTSGLPIWNGVFIVDSSVRNMIYTASGGIGTYVGAYKYAMLGTLVDDTSGTEHNTRYWYLKWGAISNNTLKNPADSKINIKLHSVEFGDYGVYSEYVVISDNYLGASLAGTFMIEAAPQTSVNVDERVRNVVIERNNFVPLDAAFNRPMMSISGSYISIRDNVGDYSIGTTAAGGVTIDRRSREPSPDSIFVYNNSFYTDNTGAQVAITVGPTNLIVTNSKFQNNLFYAPNGNGSSKTVRDYGANVSNTISNNSTDAQVTGTNPSFTALPPTTPAEWKPTGSSYAISANNGCAGSPCSTSVPVWNDFFLTNWSPTWSLGAVHP